ncbi:MAG: alpha/beta hydrolase [Actinomycetota bacterium]
MTTRRSVPMPPGGERIDLVTDDGVRLSALHVPGPGETALIVVHGFSGSWSQERVDAVIRRLSLQAPVIGIDQRGHGRSGGLTTIGHREPLDVEAAAAWARERGYARVVTIGFSMGAAVVLRHAALRPRSEGNAGANAVVAVSGPAFWYYRGTPPMRWLHRAVGSAAGRAYIRTVMGTRVDPRPWPLPPPMPPTQAASRITALGLPLLVVHGDADAFFPLDHPRALHEAAPGSDLWIEPGFGHAEGALDAHLTDRIARWALSAAQE